MNRTASTLLTTLALAAAMVAPAAAAPGGSPSPHTPTVRSAPIPLCVTTTWRARHTHQPKTRPGQWCLIDNGMWLPMSWHVAGVVLVHGEAFLLVRRPV